MKNGKTLLLLLGSVLAVAPCLPNQDSAMKRPRSQHFVLLLDATLRFYDPALAAAGAAECFLCVTNHFPHESDPATLEHPRDVCCQPQCRGGGEGRGSVAGLGLQGVCPWCAVQGPAAVRGRLQCSRRDSRGVAS